MPCAGNKITVNVSLCGSIPRSSLPSLNLSSSLRRHALENPERRLEPKTPRAPFCSDDFLAGTSELRGRAPTGPTSGFISRPATGITAVHALSKKAMLSIAPSLCSSASYAERAKSADLPSRDSETTLGVEPLHTRTPPPLIEPPPWAVPARGEARLEPVCEAIGSYSPIDLCHKVCYRVGRSPGSDVQLSHATSSRRHALIFHHPNGSCYVVDCGSAHGTFVNGVKVRSTTMKNGGVGNGASGMVVPHRVRRGAMIRFGGDGAPAFVLKSFSVGLDALVRDLGGVCEVPCNEKDGTHETAAVNSRLEGPKIRVAASVERNDSPSDVAALITLNTRLNAVGVGYFSTARRRIVRASFATSRVSCSSAKRRIEQNFLSLSPKKPRVSPDIELLCPSSPRTEVNPMQEFSSVLVSPSQNKDHVSTDPLNLSTPLVPIAKFHQSPETRKSIRKVRFSDDDPELFFPPSVTPDELSSDDESVDDIGPKSGLSLSP